MDQYKLVVINSEGETELHGDRSDENLLHVICLLNYIKEKYPNNETLKKLNERHTPNTVGFFLTLYGNIVVFNTTHNEKKHGKTGLVMMPAILSEEQKKSLESLLKEVPTYSMTIVYDLKVVDGILEAKEISSTEKISPLKVLEMYYQKVGIQKEKGNVIV